MLEEKLGAGVKVRRHQQSKQAEYVHLFSDDSCMTIHWEPLQAAIDHPATAAGDIESGVQGHQSVAATETEPNQDKNVFEECARCCMLGGDIIRQHDDNFDASTRCEPRVPKCQVCNPNYGFARKGSFDASKIVAVVPGQRSQEMSVNLADSLDFFNVSRTMTVVFKHEVVRADYC
jgi:hypothetical protein